MWVYPFSLRYIEEIVYTSFAQRLLATSFCEKDWEILSMEVKYPAKCHYSERQGGRYSDAKVQIAVSAALEAFLTAMIFSPLTVVMPDGYDF